MFKNKRITYFVLIAIFAVILFLEKRQFDSNIATIENESTTAKNTDVKSENETGNKADSKAPVAKNNSALADTPASLKKFDDWVLSEAKTLEDRTPNQKEKEAALKTRAENLTAGEIEVLKQKSVSTKTTANERIFSTYLLSLGAEATNTALVSIAEQNLSLPSVQPVHSLNESILMQEKALRTMAIDELFSRAFNDVNLRPIYLQMANQIQDLGLRKYALKRSEEFK